MHNMKSSLPCDGKHPQIRANADASELLTLRAMVSSDTKAIDAIISREMDGTYLQHPI